MSKNKENKENKNEIERHYTKQYNNMKFKIGGGALAPDPLLRFQYNVLLLWGFNPNKQFL